MESTKEPLKLLKKTLKWPRIGCSSKNINIKVKENMRRVIAYFWDFNFISNLLSNKGRIKNYPKNFMDRVRFFTILEKWIMS